MIPRGTQEWREAHRGKISASDAGSLLARVGTKKRGQLIERLALNVLDGEGLETEEFPEKWQEQHEADLKEAEAIYRAWAKGHKVEPGGLIQHPVFPWLVASPHLLLQDKGCVLLRPRQTLRSYHEHRGKLSRAWRARAQLTLFVCEQRWCNVADVWAGRGIVADRLHAQRVELESAWLQEYVFPQLKALWESVGAARPPP